MRAMGKVDPTYWATMEEWKEKEAAALFKYSGLLKRMIDATNHASAMARMGKGTRYTRAGRAGGGN